MSRKVLLFAVVALVLSVVPLAAVGAATGDGYMFEISSGGQYAFDQGRQDDADSSMSALVKGYLDGDWSVSGQLVNADVGIYTFAVGIAGTCIDNTELFDIDVTAEPAATTFSFDGAVAPPTGYDFIRIYEKGDACRTHWGDVIPTDPYGEITAPASGEVLFLGDGVDLGAKYYDDDYDGVQWAVRSGTCAAATNTVAGNVDGFSTPFDWDGMQFASSIDTTGWDAGAYCFVFNPRNDSGETDVRETEWFQLIDKPTTECPSGQVFVTSVGTGSATPVESIASAIGYPYSLTVEGTYYAGGTSKYDIQADAEYSRDEYQRLNGLPWTDYVRNYEGYGEELLEMTVDGTDVEWGPFSSSHSYSMEYVASGSSIDFQIYDVYAQNNTGGLCVDVDPIALRSVSGGGQIIEEIGPKAKDDLKVSFGGHIDDIDGGLVCEWQVNLHNVGGEDLDGSKFHASTCAALNTWPPKAGNIGADGVTNFTAVGTFNGEPGYTAIFRMEDYTEPGTQDTFRVTINGPSGLVYDTHAAGEFSDESDNVGTARTGLDKGNIQISFYE